MNNTAIKFAPAASGEKRLDVSVDGQETTIKLSSWIEGLGWCGEKTLNLSPEMLDEMHRMIAAARVRVKRETGDEARSSGKVLNFPAAA